MPFEVLGVAFFWYATIASRFCFSARLLRIISQRFAKGCWRRKTCLTRSVAAAARFYKLAAWDVLVIHDDLDLAVGQLRLRAGT